MLQTTIRHVAIKGIAVAVPPHEARLADDKTLYGGDEKQLRRVMRSSGFDRRRVAADGVTASDLCAAAARRLMRDMAVDPASIDGVLFVTQTPDYLMPATACLLQDRLGLSNATAAFDVNQGCAGYTYGLWLAGMLVQGGCRRILLLVGDTASKYTDMFREGSAPIFGDAGSATLIERDEFAAPWFFDIGTDGKGYDAVIARNGGFRAPPRPEMFYPDGGFRYEAAMDGLKVMEFTLSRVPDSVAAVLAYAQAAKDDVDYFVFHQANRFILQNIAGALDLPLAKVPMETLSTYGNQGPASIPGALCDALPDALRAGRLRLCLSGFGIGLSWASVVLETEALYCSGICNYEGD